VVESLNFDDLLAWLDSNQIQAKRKYEFIRKKLIRYFLAKGCDKSEELVDQTINRVAQKIDKIVASYSGDPALYFFGVARNIYKEYFRQRNGHS
jgi:hypothetical protein